MTIKYSARVVTTAVMLAFFSTGIQAEQAKNSGEMSEREVYLLNEIELLKKRLLDLESRFAPVSAAVSSTSTAPAHIQEPPPLPAAGTEPFSFADFSWLTGNPRTTESPIDSKVFTGELRVDSAYVRRFQSPERQHHWGIE